MQSYKCKNIITMDRSAPVVDGFFGVEDGRFAYVSDTCKTESYIDYEEKIILPGLINCHTHSPMIAFRGLADDIPLESWLKDYIFPREAEWTANDIYKYAGDAIDEMLMFGTTCFADMYFMISEIYKACQEKRIRANICNGLCSMKNDGKRVSGVLDTLTLESTDKIKIDTGFHSVYTSCVEFMQYVSSIGERFHVHVSETLKENVDCKKKCGLTPTGLLASLGFFNKKVYAAHCVYLEDSDIGIFRESGASVVHSPSSNLKLASGIANIPKYLESSINVALSTDGAASNNSLNMFSEIRLAALLHKGVSRNAQTVSAYTALEMATINGAKALGREDEIGQIVTGKKADFIVINTSKINMKPLNNSISAIVYQTNGSEVEKVYINGDEII